MPIFRRPIPRRRRRFRPLRRPQPPISSAARKARRRLQLAHELMTQGKHDQAAIIFAELADATTRHGIPRSSQLNLQTGRAWILANEVDRGVNRLLNGIQQMGSMGQLRRLPVIGGRILEELRGRGLTDEAARIEAELKQILALHGLSLASLPTQTGKPRLPAKCTFCGGNVLPDEVDWIDESSATCSYCGSLLEAKA